MEFENVKYPIIFTSGKSFDLMINRKLGFFFKPKKFFLSEKLFDSFLRKKVLIYFYDSDGVEYKVISLIKRSKRLNLLDFLLYKGIYYYVTFEYKKINHYDLAEFKERVLNMLKRDAREWKQADHDSQTDGFIISKITKAETINKIISILIS